MHTHTYTHTDTHTLTGDDIPEYLYVVIGLGSVVLLATIIVAIFVCLACLQNRNASKTAVITEQVFILMVESTKKHTKCSVVLITYARNGDVPL